jgi:hypothetical protein
MVSRAHLLVAAFVALHPYLDEAGLCGFGGCQEASQFSHATHASFSTTCLVAVLVASSTALAFVPFFGRRTTDHPLLTDAYLPPEPPRVSPSR